MIVDDAIATARLAVQKADVELRFIRDQADGQQDAYRLTQERGIKLMEVELERLRAIASVNGQGAEIMASMAQGAMSAANGVAYTVITESL